MPSPSNMPIKVIVEYGLGKHRRRREFPNMYEARRFYVAKAIAGKNPKVIKP